MNDENILRVWPDMPECRRCGISMAVPNMRWIFERIQAYELLSETPVR